MRVCDLIVGRIETLEVTRRDGQLFEPRPDAGAEVMLHTGEALDGALMATPVGTFAVAGANPRNHEALLEVLDRGLARVAWLSVVRPAAGNVDRLAVTIHEFSAGDLLPAPLEIGLDEAALEDVRARMAGHRPSAWEPTDAERSAWLASELLLESEPGPDPAPGPVAVRAVAAMESGPGAPLAFRLVGRKYALPVRMVDGKLVASALVSAGRGLGGGVPLKLLEGDFAFIDASLAATIRRTDRAALETSETYIRMWQRYDQIEVGRALADAKEAGWVEYQGYQALEDGFRFFVSNARDLPRLHRWWKEHDDQAFEASMEIPDELLGEAPEPSRGRARGPRSTSFRGRIKAIQGGGSPVIDMVEDEGTRSDDPPLAGFVHLSVLGSLAVHRRRQDAHGRIQARDCPMPQLLDILEGVRRGTPRPRRREPLSEAVLRLFGTPTPRQRQALDVAINTPDIALIQGPPGTGKTQTIRAIQARLAELMEKERGVAGQILLTSFQHVAVANAANRTEVFGLPAVKVGRRGARGGGFLAVERWRERILREGRERLARSAVSSPASALLHELAVRMRAYIAAPDAPAMTAAWLRELADQVGPHVPSALLDDLLAGAQGLGRAAGPVGLAPEDRALALAAVRRLRTHPAAFADDGPLMARACRRQLQRFGLLEDAEDALLDQAGGWDADDPLPDLQAMDAVVASLLDRLAPDRRPAVARVANPDVVILMGRLVEALRERVDASRSAPEAVLSEFLDDLEHDPRGMTRTLQAYTAVLAATCQQAAGGGMKQAKTSVNRAAGMLERGADVVFDTVIVDEAARANPLDLFVPMATARRRIILVGDHRQLPQLLEPDVERELRSSHDVPDVETALKESLFERLFRQLQAWEREDGITRTVTLDTQYRMHPVLGDFVSKAFYEARGDLPIVAGRPAEDFAHDLPGYEGVVAAWLDVPSVHGLEKQTASKSRPAEALAIARELVRLVQAAPGLSFGVIAFYRAQVDRINDALAKEGQLGRGSTDDGEDAGLWRQLGDRRVHVEVGTVDAFQGREFDVVLVSMTRANEIMPVDERTRRKKYGHLTLENRLCVALSRQQRLLVIVGDAGMVTVPGAREGVPGLVSFYELCGGAHGKRF